MHTLMKRSVGILAVAAVIVSVLTAFTLASPSEEPALDTGAHAYIAPGPGDVRSPCPALNVLANHGYLPRNGKNITPLKLFPALEKVYGLSTPLASLLSFGGFFLLHQRTMESIDDLKLSKRDLSDPKVLLNTFKSIQSLGHNAIEHRELDLVQIGSHNHIEHDASITHDDIPSLHAEYASPTNNATLFAAFLADSASRTHIDAADIGRARARRERESREATGRTIDRLHADIARGEAALVVSIFGDAPASGSSPWDGMGVPFETIRTFWWDERLPAGWRVKRETTIESIKNGKGRIDKSMEQAVMEYNASLPFSPKNSQEVLGA